MRRDEVEAPNGPVVKRELDRVAAAKIESAGNVVSGYGEHVLANQLWALAARLRVTDERDQA